LRILKDVLFERSRPFWQHCVLAFPLALIPSVTLVGVVASLFTLFGQSSDGMWPAERELTVVRAISMVLVAPIIETFVLAALLRLLSAICKNPRLVAAISAMLWGTLHGISGPMWFFGTVWSFFVFSSLYLTWRQVSFKHGYAAAMIPHLLINATAMVTLAISESV
jgi:hypothetical protein